MNSVFNALSLVELPAHALTLYGQKTASHAQLLSLQETCPVSFEVPPACAVPANPRGGFDPEKLYKAFDALTFSKRNPGVLLIRGSPLTEVPDRSLTEARVYDPRYDPQNNADRGYFRLCEGVRQVLGGHPDRGALITPMVGSRASLQAGVDAYGASNVSFIADTHHPGNPNEMRIAVVQGLGTRVDKSGSESVLMTVDRATGWITSFVNKTNESLSSIDGATPCQIEDEYRQRLMDVYDLNGERIRSLPLEKNFFDLRARRPRYIICGRLVTTWGEVDRGAFDVYFNSNLANDAVKVGLNPFHNASMLTNLIGILRFFAREVGPVQIEGAFPSNTAPRPFLYQMERLR